MTPIPRSTVDVSTRNAGIDVVRVLMTMLVILHHTAISYGGAGGWFWRQEPNASTLLLVLFNAINQSYFMGLFFLLAGYYTPQSYDRKGPGKFLADRLVRLGIPLLAFFFILHPLTVAIARTDEGYPLMRGWWDQTMARDFAPGPLWFALALLIFTFCYVGWRLIHRRIGGDSYALDALPAPSVVLATAITVGLVSFAVRLVMPVDKGVLWLHLGYFPCYILLFAVGCASARSPFLEHVSLRDAAPWILVSALAIAILPIVVLTRSGLGAFEGGWTLNALFYALWDPLVAFGVILGLFWISKRWRNRPSRWIERLGADAFGAFILHAPVLVALSVWTANWPAAPLIKFVVVGAAACLGSFAASSALRAVPGVRKII
jgi:peptidoglycan/LPS O-acetylase OafA/YrhL